VHADAEEPRSSIKLLGLELPWIGEGPLLIPPFIRREPTSSIQPAEAVGSAGQNDSSAIGSEDRGECVTDSPVISAESKSSDVSASAAADSPVVGEGKGAPIGGSGATDANWESVWGEVASTGPGQAVDIAAAFPTEGSMPFDASVTDPRGAVMS